MKIERQAQKAQKPSKRTGDKQSPRVPTHEGSQLTKPTLAKVSKGKMPVDKQAQ